METFSSANLFVIDIWYLLIFKKTSWYLRKFKIDKYEFLTGEEILSSDQCRIIEHAKFTYSPLSKEFEKWK